MKQVDLDFYRCPNCNGRLRCDNCTATSGDVTTGALTCTECEGSYGIINSIPRFVPSKTYADSFGLEWGAFATTQLDDTWQDLYRRRFFYTTDFSLNMRGQTLLEAGCGPGNFTGLILETGARLFSVDMSNSIDVCRKNHYNDINAQLLSLSQADLRSLPFPPATFDKVVCLGVIQHCPNPEEAFRSLCRCIKPGGEIVIDCYLKEPITTASWNYLIKHALRLVTTRVPERTLLIFVKWIIATLYNLKSVISKLPFIGSRLHRIVAIGELQRYDWTPTQMKRIKSLNVFDMLSPKFDNPQTIETVCGWIASEGLQLIKCDVGYNGINAKARKAPLADAGV